MNSEKINKACGIIYEAITGKCWHKWEEQPQDYYCKKCDMSAFRPIDNPDLANDYNPWHNIIFPAMSDEQKQVFMQKLYLLVDCGSIIYRPSSAPDRIDWDNLFIFFIATTTDYITAALEIEVECGKCEGKGYIVELFGRKGSKPCTKPDCEHWYEEGCGNAFKCDCTCTNGRVKLKDKVEVTE